jgi:uncharacterized ferredoxin-like protein
MARIDAALAQQEAVKTAACLMAAAARTAPKARGLDSVQTLIVDGKELELLAKAMEAKVEAKAHRLPTFARDAQGVRTAGAVLLIGVTGEPKNAKNPLNCGACGYGSCEGFMEATQREGEDFRGPVCVFQALDLGIALGSAAKVAGELAVDTRIMYTIGAAARALGFLQSDVIMGLPLSVTGKSPYFDR